MSIEAVAAWLVFGAFLLTILAPIAGIVRSVRGDRTPAPEGCRAEWQWIKDAFTQRR